MRNKVSILALICAFTFMSCTQTKPCETPTNGFLTDTDFQVKMGSSAAVDVFNQLDAAWAKRDYETLKTFIADEASLSFDDGFVATTPQEFVDKIKADAAESTTEGGNSWVTNYAFALTLTDDGSEETTIDSGDWVNAQFTTTSTDPDSEIYSEIYYEYYHIVDGKVTQWNQFKKTIKK
tara:strand:+ start:418 stop:954 length:537 start_codon:yes stop_codon:yes gene_type:complete